ncbi:hypothetical protein LTR84_007590 [Exophiala bonariae]|uniref:BTB domain-containing protein n=1 Tax=Exophiala bonariae TaxID=1690606 RepID=A0AAV9NN46_9EURO|nr:hypothetical protein LTR84_007590 [Exophiala bonariae]
MASSSGLSAKLNAAKAKVSPSSLPITLATFAIITLVVGAEKHVFTAHKEILMRKSPFFEKCLSSGMKESMTNMIHLPTDESAEFSLILSWIYGDTDLKFTEANSQKYIETFPKAWLLAQRLCMPDCQDWLIDCMMVWLQSSKVPKNLILWLLDPDNIDLEYDELKECPLFKLFYDELVWNFQIYDNHPNEDESSRCEFVQKLNELTKWWPDCKVSIVQLVYDIGVVSKKQSTEPARKRGCQYHVHPKYEPCAQKK